MFSIDVSAKHIRFSSIAFERVGAFLEKVQKTLRAAQAGGKYSQKSIVHIYAVVHFWKQTVEWVFDCKKKNTTFSCFGAKSSEG